MIDVAETSSPCRKPENAKNSASPMSTRSTKDTVYPLTVIVPTCPSCDVEAALELVVARRGTVKSIVFLSPGASSGISSPIGAGPFRR